MNGEGLISLPLRAENKKTCLSLKGNLGQSHWQRGLKKIIKAAADKAPKSFCLQKWL